MFVITILFLTMDGPFEILVYIVLCQRGGVSSNPTHGGLQPPKALVCKWASLENTAMTLFTTGTFMTNIKQLLLKLNHRVWHVAILKKEGSIFEPDFPDYTTTF